MRYTIKSKKTGKYISNLFEDKDSKIFQAEKPEKGKVYFWFNLDTAYRIARETNGELVEFE